MNRVPRRACQVCGTTVKLPKNSFCSVTCLEEDRARKRETSTCRTCAATFYVTPSIAKRRPKYCSKPCADKGRERATDDFTCIECGELKTAEDFHVDRNSARGRRSRCKACVSTANVNVVKFTPSRRENAYRNGAAHRGIAYGLTRDEFMAFWQQPCSYCGDDIPTIGLDRVDNALGYTLDNVVPCRGTCNAMKSGMKAEEFVARCRRIAARARSVATV